MKRPRQRQVKKLCPRSHGFERAALDAEPSGGAPGRGRVTAVVPGSRTSPGHVPGCHLVPSGAPRSYDNIVLIYKELGLPGGSTKGAGEMPSLPAAPAMSGTEGGHRGFRGGLQLPWWRGEQRQEEESQRHHEGETAEAVASGSKQKADDGVGLGCAARERGWGPWQESRLVGEVTISERTLGTGLVCPALRGDLSSTKSVFTGHLHALAVSHWGCCGGPWLHSG